jgi:hypothetical protein
MHSRGFLVAGLLAAFFILAGSSATVAQDAALKQFIDGIYANYKTPNSPGTRINSKALLARYFTPALAALIERDAAQAKARNEPPELNGDPFIDAQDWDIRGLAVDLKENGKDRASATVKFSNFGEAREVRLDLLKTAAGWRIDDIHWREGSLRGLYRAR